MTRTNTTKHRTKTSRRTNHAEEPGELITWHGTERPPAKRWWWFVGFFYVALLVAGIAYVAQAWTMIVLVAVAGAAVFIVYLGKPRRVTAVLHRDRLVINGQTFLLGAYRAYYVADDASAVSLVPTKYLRIAVTVPLPSDEADASRVLSELAGLLTCVDHNPTIFERLASWVRLE